MLPIRLQANGLIGFSHRPNVHANRVNEDMTVRRDLILAHHNPRPCASASSRINATNLGNASFEVVDKFIRWWRSMGWCYQASKEK